MKKKFEVEFFKRENIKTSRKSFQEYDKNDFLLSYIFCSVIDTIDII